MCIRDRVYIPPKGELMAQLLDYYENLPAAPAWFNKQQRKRIEKQEAHLPQAVRIYNCLLYTSRCV